MTWVLGVADPLTWEAARDKIRGDLWRPGPQGVPDDVCDRAIHAAILEIEAERRWLWAEDLLSTFTVDQATDRVDLLPLMGFINSVATRGEGTDYCRLTRAPLQAVRESSISSPGKPSAYAISERSMYFDTIVPAGTVLEIHYDVHTPERLEDAVGSPVITMTLHQQAVLSNAKAFVCLEFLHDEEKAARNRAAYERHIARLIDRDDAQRVELGGGSIVPDDSLYLAAHGRR